MPIKLAMIRKKIVSVGLGFSETGIADGNRNWYSFLLPQAFQNYVSKSLKSLCTMTQQVSFQEILKRKQSLALNWVEFNSTCPPTKARLDVDNTVADKRNSLLDNIVADKRSSLLPV